MGNRDASNPTLKKASSETSFRVPEKLLYALVRK